MARIISDEVWRELAAYRASGKTPEEVHQMVRYLEDPAPEPMREPAKEGPDGKQ